MTLVNTNWLKNNLSKVKIIDCSWHMPNVSRDGYKEYIEEHIKNSIFFDLDKNSDENTDLPHMLPKKNVWEKILASLGISNKDKIVIYDNSDVISSCRLWYNLIYFGHDSNSVHVLDGGLKKWKIENKEVTNFRYKN
jgi:Rhodanese-related sulfurtransferase